MNNIIFCGKPQSTDAKNTIRKLIFSFGLFIFAFVFVSVLMPGCSKDADYSDGFSTIRNTQSIKATKLKTDTLVLSEIHELSEFFSDWKGHRGSRNSMFTIDDIDTTVVLKVEFTDRYSTYSLNIRHTDPGIYYII
jgi:hypothetical protein